MPALATFASWCATRQVAPPSLSLTGFTSCGDATGPNFFSLLLTVWWKGKHFFPLPEAPIPLPSRDQILHDALLRYRCQTLFAAFKIPKVKGHHHRVRVGASRATLWHQHIR